MTTPPPRAGRREWTGLAVLFLATMMFVMDLSVLNLAIPRLSADLRPTSSELLWAVDIYGFMVAGLLVTMGTLGDRVGRRRLLLVGAAAFGLFSVLASMSTSPEMLIGTRALLGVAGATIAPSTLSLIFFMFVDPRQRRIAIGVWVAGFAAGSAVGPVLGGIVLEFFAWGAIFLLALPIVAIILLAGPRLLPEYRDPDAGRLDLTSAAMSIVAVLAIVYGVKVIAQDGLVVPAVGAIALGLVLGVLWGRRQLRSRDPMIDVVLFRDRDFDVALLLNFLGIFVFSGFVLFLAQYLQLVLGLSPLEAGLVSTPGAVALVFGAQLAPRLVPPFRPAPVIGSGLVVAGAGLLLFIVALEMGSVGSIVVATVILSLGFAPVFGLTTELVVGSAPQEQAGAVTGISETAIELGGALGIAVLGSVGVAVYRARLAETLPAGLDPELAASARDTLGGALGVTVELTSALASALASAAQAAFLDGLRVTSFLIFASVLAAAILAFTALRSARVAGSEEAIGTASEAKEGCDPAC